MKSLSALSGLVFPAAGSSQQQDCSLTPATLLDAIQPANFANVAAYLDCIRSSLAPNRQYSFIIDTGVAVQKWSQLVPGPGDTLFGVPYAADQVLKLSTSTGEVSLINCPANAFTNKKYGGGAYAPNGVVYCLGLEEARLLRIFPEGNSTVTVVNRAGFHDTVLAPNGLLYGVPYDSTCRRVISLNPSNLSVTELGDSDITGNRKYKRGALAPNAAIYCPPAARPQVLKIDTTNNSVSMIGPSFGTSNNKWTDAIVAPNNGCVYGIPDTRTDILKIDPATDTVTTFGDLSTVTARASSAVLGIDGLIYGIPTSFLDTTMLRVNPFNDTIDEVPFSAPNRQFANGTSWQGAATGIDGAMYAAPFQNWDVLKVSLGELEGGISEVYQKTGYAY